MSSLFSNLKRVQIIKEGQVVSPGYYSQFSDFLSDSIHKKSFGKKAENYTTKKFDLINHLTYDIVVDLKTDAIVSGSGIYSGGRYPEGVWRVLNRSFISPQYRSKSYFKAINTHLLLPVQIDEFSARLELIFVSREGLNGRRGLSWWIQSHANRALPGAAWSLVDDFVQIKPGIISKSVFQSIAICIRATSKPPAWNPTKLTIDEWKKLP